MNKYSITLFITFLMALAYPAWSQSETGNRAVWSGDEHTYSLQLPEGWNQLELRKEKEFTPVLIRVGAPKGIKQGGVYLQRFPRGEMTVESYKEAALTYIKESMKGAVLSEQDITLNGNSAWQLQYQGNGPGYVDAQRRFQNTVVFDGDVILVVHCAAAPELWDSLGKDFDSISKSLRIEESKK